MVSTWATQSDLLLRGYTLWLVLGLHKVHIANSISVIRQGYQCEITLSSCHTTYTWMNACSQLLGMC